MSDKQVTLTIDGRSITVPEGTLVIRAAELLGLYVPRFCDHPYLAPLGACRQCMVEVEGQRKPLTSCTTVCSEGMVVSTQYTSAVAKDAQEGVLELLLINHPLDCPTCDKGGECPLQDQTLAYGPGVSRMIDVKRRFVKPVPINNLVYLDRERCVLCARCTRFADEISGDPFIELFERGALEQVAIFENDPYESNFSGNVIQICPVGALTSKDFRFLARPFDMTSTDSSCTQCASGCSITVQERRNQIVRVLAADDNSTNDVWSCDKGRFGHAYVADRTRVTEPMVRKGGELIAVSWAEAVRVAAEAITVARAEGAQIGVLTGGNLVDEDAWALSRFARTVLATNDIAVVGSPALPTAFVEALVSSTPATNADIDAASTIVVAGIDLYEESPIVYLRVRKAAMRGARVVEIGPRATRLPGEKIVVPPDQVAASIEQVRLADGSVVVLAGERLAGMPGALESAWNAAAGIGAAFGYIPRKGGIRGALAAGIHSGPVREDVAGYWESMLPARGRSAHEILESAATGGGLLLLAGADPVRDHDDPALAQRALASGVTVIATDMFLTDSTKHATVILPVAAPPERDGTMTNWEGRPRPIVRALDPAGLATVDWEILARIAVERETNLKFPRSLEQIQTEMHRFQGPTSAPQPLSVPAIEAASSATEGAFTLITYRLLRDAGTLMTGANELAATVEAPFVEIAAADASRMGIAEGETVTVSGSRGSATVVARVRSGIADGCVFIPQDQPGLHLFEMLAPGDPVKVAKA